uniref:Uncharacterized protein n=1 Tax=Ditylenchus dipsaci TaxID=166011 RepID=A0A915D1T5_9BILA
MLAKQPSSCCRSFYPTLQHKKLKIKRAWTAQSQEKTGIDYQREMLHSQSKLLDPHFNRLVKISRTCLKKTLHLLPKGQKPKKAGVRKKRLGKAAKKQLAAAKLADADVCSIMLKKNCCFSQPMLCFNTPCTLMWRKLPNSLDSARCVTYRPYRRVCLLTLKQLVDFAENVLKFILHRSKS